MDTKSTIAISLVTASSLALNGFLATQLITKSREETKAPESQMRASEGAINFSYNDLQEINHNIGKVIIYESSEDTLTLSSSSGSYFPRHAKVQLNYSYNVSLDVTKAKVMQVKDQYLMTFHMSDVKIESITIGTPNIENDLNFISSLYGEDIARLNQTLLEKGYIKIDELVQEDFKANMDTSLVKEKLEIIYNGLPVIIQVIK